MTGPARDGGLVAELTRVRRWHWEARISTFAPGQPDPVVHLVTVRGATRRAAQRRAARFIEVASRLDGDAG